MSKKAKFAARRHPLSVRTVRSSALAAAAAIALAQLAPSSAKATDYYWDTNGAPAFGSVTGGWDGINSFWNTDNTGDTTGTFIASPTAVDDLFLNGGTAGTITLTGTQTGSSLTLSNNVANTITGGILQLGGTGASSGLFLTNAITTAQSVSSAISLNAASTIQNAGTGVLTVSGGITGIQNLILQNNGATANGVTISTLSLNNTGTVTNSGTGAGSTLISAGVGTNVTTINQGSSTSALTLSGAITVGATNKIFNSTGSSLFTISGGATGTGNVTFNANSTGNITLSTAALNNTGTVTNSGTNSGLTTISSVIGTAVTGVIQNSATSQLTLSNAANTFTSAVTISRGQLNASSVTGFGSITAVSNLTLGSAGAQGILNYTGAASSSTRPILVGGIGGGVINSTTGLLTLTGTVSLASGPLTIGGANNVTIGSATAAVAQVLGTNALTKTGGGTLTLSTLTAIAPIATAMPINLQAGTLAVQTSATGTTTNPLGTGALTITPGSTLTFLSGGHVWNLGNAITIANTTATANISGTGNLNVGTTAANTIAFAAGANTPILRFSNPSTGSPFLTQAFSTISGTGNVELNGTNAGFITVSGPQNQTGTIRNVGTSTNVATLSGTIGSGITAISQAGSSPFTVSSSVPLSATLNSFTSTGAGAFNFTNASTFSGTQALTFNANSTGGINVSGTNLNHTGTVTNTGTNTGATTISSAIGANVGNIIQNSASSPLVLSGTNTTAYVGTFTATNGVLQFSSTGAIAGFTGTPNANVRISVANGGILGFAYPAVGGADITTLVSNANGGTYSNVTFAATGASIGLDTAAGSSSFGTVLANPTGSALGLVKLGTNTLTLGNANTYSGRTWVQNGTLSVSSVGNVAVPVASSLGMPVNATDGTISLGFFTNAGTLSYTGAGETSDRNIALAGTTGGGTIDNSGAGTLTLGGVTSTGVGAKALTISGASNTTFGAAVAGGTLNGAAQSTSPLTVIKTGNSTLTLSGTGNSANILILGGGILDIGANGLTLANSSVAFAGNNVVQNTGSATINGTGGGVLTLSSGASATDGANFGTASGTTLTVNVPISIPTTGAFVSQSGAFEVFAGANTTGTVILNGVGTWASNTNIYSGTVQVSSIGNTGSPTSPLGQGSVINFAVSNAPRLTYTGSGETTNRTINLGGTTTGGVIDASGTTTIGSPLTFSSPLTTTGNGAKTLTLQGTGAGVFGGAIVNSTGTTGVTKAGTGTWTLSGLNTYTGATTVTGGNLRLTTGTTNNSAVTVNNGGTLSIVGNYTIGNAATAAAGGSLTLTAGGTLDLADGVINDLTLTQNATFATAGAAFNGGTIRLDVSGADADSIINSGGLVGSTSSGSNSIVINPIAGFAPGGPYTIISGGAGTGTIDVASNIFLATSTISFGGSPFTLSLSQVGKNALLTITAGVGGAPGLAYWNGTTNSSWAYQPGGAGTATNWVAAASGGPDTLSLPGPTSNIVMTSNTVGIGGLTTTIDTVSAVNSLNFGGTGSSNTAGSIINAGSGTTLTLNAAAVNGNAAGNGMTIAAGSGANLINVPIVLGANQTWTNNSTNATTVSSVISEASAGVTLTKAGTGPMTLSGAASNTYTGLTTVIGSGNSAGGLTLAKTGGAIAIPGHLTIGSGTATQAHVLLGENEQISPTATVTFTGISGGWGYLQLQGRTQTIGNIVETTPGFGVIETREAAGTFGNSNVIFNVSSGTQTYQGYFRDINTGLDATNSLKLTKAGAGTLQWGAANTAGAAGTTAAGHNYSGGTDIQNGTLQLLAANTASAISIVGAGNVSLNGGATFAGTLDLNNLNAGITGLDGTTGTVLGRVVNNGAATATLSIGNNGNSGSFAGLLLNNNNAGTGILAVTKVGTGTQVLSGANTYTGVTTLTAGTLSVGASNNLGGGASNLVFDGGTLQITGTALSSVSTIGHTVVFNATKTVGLDIANAGHTFTVDQVLNQTTGGFTKLGAGTVVLSQANTYTGNTNVTGGTLNVTGTLTGNGTATTGSQLLVGTAAGNSIINVSNNISTYFRYQGATVAGANAVYNQTAGNVTLTSTQTGNPNNNLAVAGYGYMNLTGGTFKSSGRFGPSNGVGTTGVMYIGGTGVFDHTSGEWFLMAYSPSGDGGLAQVTVGPGGNLNRVGASSTFGLNMDRPNGYAVFSMAGGQMNNGVRTVAFGNGNNTINTTGILNLADGVLTIGVPMANNPGTGTGNTGYLNFAGGTLSTSAAVTAIIPASSAGQSITSTIHGPINNSAVPTAPSFVGGLTVDTNGFNSTLTNALLAPAGTGVRQVDLTLSGGTGYVGAPAVQFSKPAVGGSPASGYALISAGAVTGIVITSPGDYAVGEIPTVTLTGGGASSPATVTVAPLNTAAPSGGLTKIDNGTLTLSSAANSYSGVVTISGGTLQSSGLGTLANIGSNSALGTGNATSTATNAASLVLNGGTYNITGTNASVSTNRLFTLTQNGGGIGVDNGTAGFLVTFANTNAIAYTGSGPRTLTLSGAHPGSATNFHTFAPLIGNAGSDVVSLTKTGTTAWALTNAGNTYSGPTTISGGILSVPSLGGIVGTGLAASHLGSSSNAAANLVLSGGTLQYTGGGETSDRNYTFGNATTAAGGGFDTSGATGPLVISGSMTGANVAAGTQVLTLTSLAASGANALNSNIINSSVTAITGVTKAGVGSWNLAGTNTYTGATNINQGKLALTGGSLDNTAISVATNATIAPIGTAGSFTAGNATTPGSGASLNIAAGGTLNMQDNAIGIFTLTQHPSFTPAPLALASANLSFDIGSAGPDQIVVSGGLTAGTFTGTNVVNLNGVGSSLTPGTYSLITAPGILAPNTVFRFSNGFATMSLPVGLLSYPLTLQSIAGTEQIVVGAGVGNFTWTGKQDGLAANADNSIWTAALSANNNFADSSPAVQNYTNGSSVTFQDLNVISAANVTNSAVNIDAAGVLPGSVTVNNTLVNYTLSTSGSVGIAGDIGLNKSGAGTLTLSSINTYSGITNIDGGIVNVGIATALGTGTIAFGGGTLQYGTGVTTDFSNRFSTASGELISIDTNGNNVTLATAMTSPGGTLTKSGAGILTVTGANTFDGAVTVNGGTLLANYNAGTPTTVFAAASTINVAGGATFRAVANDSNFTLANNLTGSGLVVIDPHLTAGAAVRDVTISGTNVGFTGTLRLSPTVVGDGLGTFRTNQMTPAQTGGATIDVDAGGQAWLSAATFTNNFILTGQGYAETAGGTPVAASGLTQYSGVLKGGIGAIRMNNGTIISGNVTLDGSAKIMAHNATGTISGSIGVTNLTDTLVVGGGNAASTLILTGTNNLGANALTNVFVNSGGTTGTQTLAIGANGTTGTLGTGSVTLNGDGATGAIRFDRADGYTLAAGNTITSSGTTTANTRLFIDTQGTGFVQNGVNINLGGGALQFGTQAGRTGATGSFNGNVTVGAINVGTASTGAVMNILPGANIANSGNFFLGELASMSGTVIQSGGDVSVGTHVRVGHFPTNTSVYNISAGTLAIANINTATDPSGTGEQSGGIYLGVDGTGTMAHSGGTVTTDWIVLDNRVDTVTPAPGIDSYTLSGSGLLVLRSQWGITQRNTSTAVTLAGGTIRNGGTNLQVRLDTAPDISGAVTLDTVSAGNSFNWTRNAAGAGSLALSGGGTLKFTTTTTQSVAVPVSGTGALEKLGTGTTTLSVANTYNGTTGIGAGTLQVGVASAIPSGAGKGNVVFSAAATTSILDLNGFDININGLSQPTATTVNLVVNNATGTNKTLTLGNNDATATFAGIIANNTSGTGTLALTKTGISTQTLAGANTYTGQTTITAGTLAVTGSISSATQVLTGGTLAGNGQITGDVTTSAGGSIRPGVPGGSITSILTVKSLAMANDPTAVFGVDITGLTVGTGYDQIALPNAGTSTVSLAGASLSVKLGTLLAGDGSEKFVIINNASGVNTPTGQFSSVIVEASPAFGVPATTTLTPGTLNPNGGFDFTDPSNGFVYTLVYNVDSLTNNFAPGTGNDVVLSVVPEPGSLALAAMAGLGLLARRRRR